MGQLLSSSAPRRGIVCPDGKWRKLVLCGPAAAGKTHAANALAARGYKVALSVTTRQQRPSEEHDVDYHFVSDAAFDRMEPQLYESVTHGVSRYGITRDTFENSDVLVMNPDGIRNICEHGDRDRVWVVYLDPPETKRHARLIEREWTAPEIEARDAADTAMFKSFTDYNVKVSVSEFDIVDVTQHAVMPVPR